MKKEKKPTYKWVNRLVDKITRMNSPVNNEFIFYGHRIIQLSGVADETSVTILETDNRYSPELADFSFDFWTKELHFEGYIDYNFRDAIVKAFVTFYNSIIVSDGFIEDERKNCEEIVNKPDIYTEEAVAEAREELERLNNLPIGEVGLYDIK